MHRITLVAKADTGRKFKAIAAYRGISMSKLLEDLLFGCAKDTFEEYILSNNIETLPKDNKLRKEHEEELRNTLKQDGEGSFPDVGR